MLHSSGLIGVFILHRRWRKSGSFGPVSNYSPKKNQPPIGCDRSTDRWAQSLETIGVEQTLLNRRNTFDWWWSAMLLQLLYSHRRFALNASDSNNRRSLSKNIGNILRAIMCGKRKYFRKLNIKCTVKIYRNSISDDIKKKKRNIHMCYILILFT